ncbi:MAG: rhodanese-like domain-containing protein [Burkholderiaceae bacterium]
MTAASTSKDHDPAGYRPVTAAGHPQVTAAELRSWLADGTEIAFVDVREEGVFARAHPFLAISLPFSHLETRLAARIPRRNTRIVLFDERGEGLAARAADRMRAWGYDQVRLLAGGLQAWQAAGFEVFSGVHVPSKAFGEFVEHWYGTPAIDAAQLREWLDTGKDLVILDSRPFDEYHQYALPGGIDCPGAELVHRAFDLAPDPGTTVVINCAGRTRGIIGAQSLINAGLPNPVVVLENGTAGWHLHGERMSHGNSRVAAPPTPQGLQQAREAARRVAERFGVREIDAAGYARLRAESAQRSLFLFDVRLPAEYQAGHLPGARSAPGGQLIQSTDQYVGPRGARIVLCDDNGVRARITASWLVQLGWPEVFVLAGGLRAFGPALETGPEPVEVLGAAVATAIPELPVLAVARALEAGDAVVVDLASSLKYRAGHIPGAWFTIRSRLADSLSTLPRRARLVVTSEDGSFAQIAAADVAAATTMPVATLQGGTAAWRSAGLPLAQGFECMASEPDDVWYSPYEYDDLAAAMRDYLDWEVALVEQIERMGEMPFVRVPVA